MRRLRVLLVVNPECETDRAGWMLEKMGHQQEWVFNAVDAIREMGSKAFDAVIIDGFDVAKAELVALEIKLVAASIYIGIVNGAAKHRRSNGYADEVIPETFVALKEVLEYRF